MGFYYGPGQPPDKEPQGGLREALLITWVVFKTLALPLGILFGGLAYLVLLFVLFTVHPLLGLGGILVVVAAIGVRGLWELKHPPRLE